MASFQYFQNQPEQKSNKPNFPNPSLSLSLVLQYADTAKKQNFEALCRMQPLVKSYRDRVEGTMREMAQAGSTLGEEVEMPAAYTAAFTDVEQSFSAHLKALDEWLSAFTQKNESQSDKAMLSVQQSGQGLESALDRLSTSAK